MLTLKSHTQQTTGDTAHFSPILSPAKQMVNLVMMGPIYRQVRHCEVVHACQKHTQNKTKTWTRQVMRLDEEIKQKVDPIDLNE